MVEWDAKGEEHRSAEWNVMNYIENCRSAKRAIGGTVGLLFCVLVFSGQEVTLSLCPHNWQLLVLNGQNCIYKNNISKPYILGAENSLSIYF